MMGQGAGASSIMHHVATSPHRSKSTLRAAILQSPAFFPQPNSKQADETYEQFLQLAKAKDLDELVTVDTKVLQDANAKMIHEAKYGSSTFGPTIDHTYVKDIPSKILAQAQNDELRFPTMLIGHKKWDGLFFTPPWIRTTEALLAHVRELFHAVPQSVLDKISSDYPVPDPEERSPQVSLQAAVELIDVGSFIKAGPDQNVC